MKWNVNSLYYFETFFVQNGTDPHAHSNGQPLSGHHTKAKKALAIDVGGY